MSAQTRTVYPGAGALLARPVKRARCLSGVVLALAVGGATAQGLPDPTRPSGAFQMGPEAEPPLPGQLQMIVHGTGARPWALIDGQRVELGSLLGDERLIRLTEDEAVLRGPAGMRRLRLLAGVEPSSVRSPRNALRESR